MEAEPIPPQDPNVDSDNPPRPQPDYFLHQPPPPPPPSMYRAPQDPVLEVFRTVKAMLWSTAFVSYLVIIILSLIVVLAMTPEIQSWITTPSVASSTDPSVLETPDEYIFIIFPFPILLFSINGPGFQAWHFAMLTVLIGAFFMAKYDLWRSWLSRKGQMLLSLVAPEKAQSSLEGVAKLFMASTFFSIVYFIFLALGGIEMNTPDFESLSRAELIYGLFNASVFEEIISRMLLIGIPLVFLAIVQGWKNPLKRIIGGGLDINWATMGLITFSAVFFALAHAPGWDFWKVPQVLITGFALGYAFVRYGLHASIMVHFSINLSSSALDVWPDNLAIGALIGISFFIWVVLGGYFFFDYAWRLSKKLSRIGISNSHVQQSSGHSQGQESNNYFQQPVTPGHPDVAGSKGFICPSCGHTGAVYSGGTLKCIRCNTIYGDQAPSNETSNQKEMYEF